MAWYVSQDGKFKKRNIVAVAIIVILSIIMILSLNKDKRARNEKLQQLIDSTEYVSKYLPGIWKADNGANAGAIAEIYPEGYVVFYIPGGLYGRDNPRDELQTIEYFTYTIPEPRSYSNEELQSYIEYCEQNGNGIGLNVCITIGAESMYALYEFRDMDTYITNGEVTWKRIENQTLTLSNDLLGLYLSDGVARGFLPLTEEAGICANANVRFGGSGDSYEETFTFFDSGTGITIVGDLGSYEKAYDSQTIEGIEGTGGCYTKISNLSYLHSAYSGQDSVLNDWGNSTGTGTEWWFDIPETRSDYYKYSMTTDYYKDDIISWAYRLTGMKFWVHLDNYKEGRTADNPPYIIIEAFLKAQGMEAPFEDDIYALTAIVNPRDPSDLYLYIKDNTYGIDICEYNNSSVSEAEGDDVIEESTNVSTPEPIMPMNPVDTVPPTPNVNIGTVDTTPPSQSTTEKPENTEPPEPVDTVPSEPEKVVKPFAVETLAKVSISDISMFATMDDDNNLIYYDNSKNAILSLNPDSGEVKTLLDIAAATYTGSDGVIYEGLTVNQVFWDDVASRLLVDGTFRSTKLENGGETENGSQPYSAIFALKDGTLEKIFEKPADMGSEWEFEGKRYQYLYSNYYKLSLSINDGKYMCSGKAHGMGNNTFNVMGIVNFSEEPASVEQFALNTEDGFGYFGHYEMGAINRDIYCIEYRGLFNYDYEAGKWAKVNGNYIDANAFDFQNSHFYAWESNKIQAIRPSDGACQTKLNPAKDVEILDMQALPTSPDNLFVTTDEQYLFYDSAAEAIRVIRSNPEAN